MNRADQHKFLRHSMYRLYYLRPGEELHALDRSFTEAWRQHYSQELRESIKKATELALADESMDLSCVLPDLGHDDDSIRLYLRSFLRLLDVHESSSR